MSVQAVSYFVRKVHFYLLCKQKSTLSSGMAAPSESMDLCVDKIFSYAPIRRRQTSHQHQYYNSYTPKSQPSLMANLLFISLHSQFFIPLFQGSHIVLLGETSAGAGALFLAAITWILHNHKPPIQSAFQASTSVFVKISFVNILS